LRRLGSCRLEADNSLESHKYSEEILALIESYVGPRKRASYLSIADDWFPSIVLYSFQPISYVYCVHHDGSEFT